MSRSKQGKGQCNAEASSGDTGVIGKHKRRAERFHALPAVKGDPDRLLRSFRTVSLVARSSLRAGGLGDADVAGHFVLGDGIDHHLQRAAIITLMEEDGFIDG